MTRRLSEGGAEITGSLKQLPSLPNAEHQRLFNAENCTVSAEGRVFITGSTAVYEILPASGRAAPGAAQYEYRQIPVTADEVPKDCLWNGLATYGDYLYMACAHIKEWDKAAFPNWRPALNAISQTRPLNLLWLWLAEVFEWVDSYVVRANLRKDTVEFNECVKIEGKCLANGLAADSHGNLYLANTVPGSSCIYKINWCHSSFQHSIWFKTHAHQLINGLKWAERNRRESVYFTCMPAPLLARLDEVKVNNEAAGEHSTTYSSAGFFDDFDTAPGGFVISNGSDLLSVADTWHLHRGMARGSLIFISAAGKLLCVFRDEKLIHPSSVKVVKHDRAVFAKGDVIVTDKGIDGEYAAHVFMPDDPCRSWFS